MSPGETRKGWVEWKDLHARAQRARTNVSMCRMLQEWGSRRGPSQATTGLSYCSHAQLTARSCRWLGSRSRWASARCGTSGGPRHPQRLVCLCIASGAPRMLAPRLHRRHVFWPPQCPAESRGCQSELVRGTPQRPCSLRLQEGKRTTGRPNAHSQSQLYGHTSLGSSSRRVPCQSGPVTLPGPLCLTCTTGVTDTYRFPIRMD